MAGFRTRRQIVSAAGAKIADAKVASFELKGVDGKDYITVNSTNDAETIKLGQQTVITGPGGTTGFSIPATNCALLVENSTGDSNTACTIDINGDGSGGAQVRFREADTEYSSIVATDASFLVKTESGNKPIILAPHGSGEVQVTGPTTIAGRTVITADTSGTPDDLGDFDNYALVLQGSSNTNDETALLLSSDGDTYGGSAIVHKDTGAGGQGDLKLYAKASTAAEPPLERLSIDGDGMVTVKHHASPTAADIFQVTNAADAVVCKINSVNTNGGELVLYRGGVAAIELDAQSGSYFNNAGMGIDFRVESDNEEYMFNIDGSADSVAIGAAVGVHKFHVQDGDAAVVTNSADAVAKSLVFTKSRSATDGTAVVVQDNDILGNIEFQGAEDGDSFATGAKIFARVDGTPGDGDMPTELVFATTPDGAEVAVERVTIAATGATTITGVTNIKIADTNVTPDTSCDDFIIEGTGSTGMSVVTPNNVSGCYAFRSEASGGGDPSDKHIAIVQGKRDAANNNTVLHRLLDHQTNANSYFAFETGGAHRLKIDGTGATTITGPTTVNGDLSLNLSDATSVITDGATGTNRYVASTDHDLVVGQAIRIDSATYTVATVTDADNFILDSDHGSTGDKGQATTDNSLLHLQSGDGNTIFKVSGNGAVELGYDDGTNRNVGIGDSGMFGALTTGQKNVFIGHDTGDKVVAGNNNTCIGFKAGEEIAGGNDNVFIGQQSGNNVTGYNNTAVGSGTMNGNGTTHAVAVGHGAMAACTGIKNVAVGTDALKASGASANCVAVGYSALSSSTGNNNIGIGWQAGNGISSGSSNISIGGDSDVNATGSNQIAIGLDSVVDATNKVRLGNTSITNIDGEVAFNATSDARTKANVEELALGLDFINALRPVSFTRVHPAEYPAEILDKRYKQGQEVTDEDGNISFASTPSFDADTNQPIKDEFDEATRSDGLIAQEVQAVCDSMGVAFNGINTNEQGKLGLQYSLLVSPLIKAVQELTARIATLEAGD